MTRRLEGAGIVVTRPDGRDDPLARRLAAEGATVLPFPALHVEPLEEKPPASSFDAILFTSPAAVRWGLPRLPTPLPELRLTPGTGTRAALTEADIENAFAPQGGAGMAALLNELPTARLAGQRLLVVCGRPVNEAGLSALSKLGAEVTVFAVYARKPAKDAGALAQWLQSGAVNVIMASSVAAVKAMSQLSGIDLRSTDWIVSSTRVEQTVLDMGSRVVAVAHSAETDAMTAATCRWWQPDT